ncbi:MAG: hypothetical protein JWN64_546 [Parcubacteria group bacterium]|nr:hypothetical protein [Parcubacteria group bacterium]
MKRILIIVASIIVLIGIGVGIWFFFFANGAATLEPSIANPFGTSGDATVTTPDSGTAINGAGEVVAPHLIKITDKPVAEGSVAIYIPEVVGSTTASSTVPSKPADVEVRYIDRASGNIYAYRAHERVQTRLSNKTLPGIQEASWASDGSRVFARFLERTTDGSERTDTYALQSNGEGGFFLEQNLAQASVRGTSTVLTLLPSSAGSLASLSNLDGTNTRTLFSSALSALRLGFLGTSYLATTKASSDMAGYSFSVDAAGSFTRVLGPLNGLSTLPSPSGAYVLYSYTDRGKLYTQVLDVLNHTATPIPLSTLADKCVWRRDSRAIYCGVPTALTGKLPDEWYQGARTFNDRIWSIDLDTRVATLIVDPSELAKESIDAVALTIDSQSDVLIFTNKADSSLWMYDL